ncbi:MAG: cyclase family protein [Spirochaetes bacterium]|nr:cyclase family protein [Spirochaetota bacterium]
MKLIDLTHTLNDKIQVYPEDKPVEITQDKQFKNDFYNNFILESGMHAGTHIDGPMHLTDSTDFIGDISLDTFIGNACLLDVRYQNIIAYNQNMENDVNENDIVLLYTGYDSEFGNETYFDDHPVIDKKFAEFLIRKNIKMLGIDTPSPDNYPFEIHKMLLENGILIIENLINLEKLLFIDDFEIIAFPLKIEADSSLARVVARINE